MPVVVRNSVSLVLMMMLVFWFRLDLLMISRLLLDCDGMTAMHAAVETGIK